MIMFDRHVMCALTSTEMAARNMANLGDSIMHLHADRAAVECHLVVDGPPIDVLKLMLLLHCAAARRFVTGPMRPPMAALVVAVCSGHPPMRESWEIQ